MRKIVFYILVAFTVLGCNSIKSIKRAIVDRPPYEQYIKSLEKAALNDKPMAAAWISAGQRVFDDSVLVGLPFTESGFFPAGEPEARSYRFDVKEGQVLTIEGAVIADKGGHVFMDLFVWKDHEWEHLAYADSTLHLMQEFRQDYSCLLRVQPELLINAYYSLTISPTPVLINPVAGASNRSIGSFYGADRDGGRRRHEGLDIFAPKGTPVVAPIDGYVNRVGTNNLGGKVVWMRDHDRGHSYYFAHLDEQLVQSGMRVKQGDTLGLVGNTGNARTTPPHLHFGIYQRGSKDPIHYVRTLEAMESAPLDTSFQVRAYKVSEIRINLRSGPGKKHAALAQLEKNTWTKVISQSGDWYRIALPDKKQGYVHKNLLKPIAQGRAVQLKEPAVLLSEVATDAVPVAYLKDASEVEVLAEFGSFRYVKTGQDLYGWLEAN
jgi:murein DD-endopeptidase MepM/ murein hydrolase activator NlpD